MKTDDELINEIERRTVLALCWFATDKKESEKQMRHARDNVRELMKRRRQVSICQESESTPCTGVHAATAQD